MERNETGRGGELTARKPNSTTTNKSRDFSRFDQAEVAVILRQAGREFVFRGVATFQLDDKLGRILRVCGENGQDGDLILSEETWEGRVIPDIEHGCRYCFIPSSGG